jgi:hypothetical protein
MNLKHYLQTTKSYISAKSDTIIGITVVAIMIALIVSIIAFIQNSTPKIVYQPAKACNLLTLEKAKDMLGARTLKSGVTEPVQNENTATSKCGYTDGNPDTKNLLVAAIIVRSGVNDDGVEQNRSEFTGGRPDENVEIINDLGDSAYYNQANGQLNVLDGRNWIIFSYGIGSNPATNTVEKSVELAKKVLSGQTKRV